MIIHRSIKCHAHDQYLRTLLRISARIRAIFKLSMLKLLVTWQQWCRDFLGLLLYTAQCILVSCDTIKNLSVIIWELNFQLCAVLAGLNDKTFKRLCDGTYIPLYIFSKLHWGWRYLKCRYRYPVFVYYRYLRYYQKYRTLVITGNTVHRNTYRISKKA